MSASCVTSSSIRTTMSIFSVCFVEKWKKSWSNLEEVGESGGRADGVTEQYAVGGAGKVVVVSVSSGGRSCSSAATQKALRHVRQKKASLLKCRNVTPARPPPG